MFNAKGLVKGQRFAVRITGSDNDMMQNAVNSGAIKVGWSYPAEFHPKGTQTATGFIAIKDTVNVFGLRGQVLGLWPEVDGSFFEMVD